MVGPEALFKASGHLSEFDDPLVECEECSKNYRADQLIEGGDGMSRKEMGEALKSMCLVYQIYCADSDWKNAWNLSDKI